MKTTQCKQLVQVQQLLRRRAETLTNPRTHRLKWPAGGQAHSQPPQLPYCWSNPCLIHSAAEHSFAAERLAFLLATEASC